MSLDYVRTCVDMEHLKSMGSTILHLLRVSRLPREIPLGSVCKTMMLMIKTHNSELRGQEEAAIICETKIT